MKIFLEKEKHSSPEVRSVRFRQFTAKTPELQPRHARQRRARRQEAVRGRVAARQLGRRGGGGDEELRVRQLPAALPPASRVPAELQPLRANHKPRVSGLDLQDVGVSIRFYVVFMLSEVKLKCQHVFVESVRNCFVVSEHILFFL